MPPVTSCSSCGNRLKVRDDALGCRVRCPACGEVFVARSAAGTDGGGQGLSKSGGDTYTIQTDARPPAPPGQDERPRRSRRRPVSDIDDEGDLVPDARPHRGPLILTLGILSLVLSCIPLAGWILGAISMSMGSGDERLMEQRFMDRSGYGMTRTGRICGIIGVFLATVVFILALFIRVNRLVRHW